jgi:hypothetical protein
MRYLIILLTILTTQATAQSLTETQRQLMVARNLLVNGGFENGKQRWTPNDTADFAVTGSSPMVGLYHATWDADASTDTLVTTAVTIPAGMYGRSAVASCVFTTASGTATVEIQAYDGSNVLSESSITSSTSPSRSSTNFVMPSSGSIQLRLYANADEPSVAIDECYIGSSDGFNVGTYAAAQFIGSAYIPATSLCTPTRANTAIGAFGSDTDCPGPTVESNPGPATIQTTDNNGPGFPVNAVPPGIYRVRIQTAATMSSASGASNFAINDGTTTAGEQAGGPHTTATRGLITVEATFTYTSTANRTFTLYGKSSAGTITLDMDGVITYFSLYRYPGSNEQSYTPDKLANSWSGYHDTTCSWARTNTAFGDPTADATCTFTERTNVNFGTVTSALSGSDKLPGIVFTPPRAGRYYVCVGYYVTSSAGNPVVQLVDGSGTVVTTGGFTTSGAAPLNENCGIYVASSTSSVTLKLQTKTSSGSVTIGTTWPNVEWKIFQIDQNLPAPLLVNSVVNPRNGVTNIVSAYIDFGGGASPSVSREDGDWISSLTDNGTGDTTININSGIFSAAPNCTCTATQSGVGTAICRYVDGVPATSSQVRFKVLSGGGTALDDNIAVICVGPK